MNEKEAIEQAVAKLKAGEVILCPSDTIYGLSCDATNDEAVEKIMQLKGRSASKSFIVLVNSDRMVNQCIKEIPDVAWDMMDLAEKPLTLVMEATSFISKKAINQDGSLGIRMVKSGSCYELIKRFNKPIISTSANISGEATPLSFDEITREIKENVAFAYPPKLANGLSNSPSKIVRIQANGEIEILRK
jgi:L-threonylcarbamoyladenylate synthase